MIDFNDRFIGLILGLLVVLAPLVYIAIFGKVEKKGRKVNG